MGIRSTPAAMAIVPVLPEDYGALRDGRPPVGHREERDDWACNDEPRSLVAPKHAARDLSTGSHAARGDRSANPLTVAARAEAATGAWLDALETVDPPPRTLPPGIKRGYFGAWEMDEEDWEDLALRGVRPEVGGGGGRERPVLGAARPGESDRIVLPDLESLEAALKEMSVFSGAPLGGAPGAPSSVSSSTEPETAETAAALALPAPPAAVAVGKTDAAPPSQDDASLRSLLGVDQLPDWAFNQLGSLPALQPRKPGEPRWATREPIPDLPGRWEALQHVGAARTWPFDLDAFQKESILHMEDGRSVFVAAHTSAGKTVVAEYALALARAHRTRAVYTSPIKAISNQKFRDFSEEFPEGVGLLTGDVQIRPDADCLVMTTEILRSMLYRGADIIQDIEWVIFDEVHYVNDAERGVVWEEAIILLPDHVRLLFLSATVPNVLEFADWVGRVKNRVVRVTGTTKRPVPLEHKLYLRGKFFPVVAHDQWDPQGYKAARAYFNKDQAPPPATRQDAQRALPDGKGRGGLAPGRGRGGGSAGGGGGGGGGRGGRGGGGGGGGQLQLTRAMADARARSGQPGAPKTERTQWMGLFDRLREQSLLPCIVFCFSRRRIDTIADALSSHDFGTQAHEVRVACDAALSRLHGSDRHLPQVTRICAMLERGLAVHHSGLLPIVRELVEMLFCRGLIKVLFATETFAMGVNAPARTVVFQTLRKHDGQSFRSLLPGEYAQMAGRAGRRGLDAVGTVLIAAWDDLPWENALKKVCTGTSTHLESRFRLTYSMILNLLRIEDLRVEDVLRRSFAEHRAQRAHPEIRARIEAGRDALAALRARPWPESPLGTTREDVEAYAAMAGRLTELETKLSKALAPSRALHAALSPGRVALVSPGPGALLRPAVVLGPAAAGPGADAGGGLADNRYVLLSLGRPGDPALEKPEAQTPAAQASPAPAPAAAPATASAPAEPALVAMKPKKNDDDDAFGLSGGRAGGKRGKRGGATPGAAKGGSLSAFGSAASAAAAAAAAAQPPVPLPHASAIAGTDVVLSEWSPHQLINVTNARIDVDAPSCRAADPSALSAAVAALLRAEATAGSAGLRPLDPVSDLKLLDLDLASEARERSRLYVELASHPVHRDPMLPELFAMIWSERQLAEQLVDVLKSVSESALQQLPEFEQRVRVLQRLGMLDLGRMVTLKGRVACELNCGDEVVTAEMVFDGLLNNLTPAEAAGLLSGLVFQGKSERGPKLPPALEHACKRAEHLAQIAGDLQAAEGLPITSEEYVRQSLRFGLAGVVHEWAKGVPFVDICKDTDVMEGTIVRTIVRLDECCRELRDAARVMGDLNLMGLMEEVGIALKRTIAFAASLYVA